MPPATSFTVEFALDSQHFVDYLSDQLQPLVENSVDSYFYAHPPENPECDESIEDLFEVFRMSLSDLVSQSIQKSLSDLAKKNAFPTGAVLS